MRTSISITSGRWLAAEGDRLGAVAGLADHLDVGLAAEQHAERHPHQRLIVGDDDPDRHSASP